MKFTKSCLLLVAIIGLTASEPVEDNADERKLEANGVKVEITLKGAKLKISEMASKDEDKGGAGDDVTTAAPEDMMTTVAAAEATTTEAAGGGRKRRATDEDGMYVMVDLVSVTEVDLNGTEVGSSDSTKKHMFDALGEQVFSAGDANNGSEIPYSIATEGTKKIPAQSELLQADLESDGARLTMQVFVPEAVGSIDIDKEVMAVKSGQVKFTVKMEKWTWCTESADNCMNGDVKEVGEFLDLVVKVTSSQTAGDKKEEENKPVSYDIGGNVMFMASKKVKKGAMWADMESGYPKHEKSGDKATLFTFRFPKPATDSNMIEYDPTVQIPITGSGVTGGVGQMVASMVCLVLGVFLAMF